MLKRILATALAVGLAGTSTAYAQMNHGDNAMQRDAMHQQDARTDRHDAVRHDDTMRHDNMRDNQRRADMRHPANWHDNGNHNGWRKHNRCWTEWRHHRRVRVCR